MKKLLSIAVASFAVAALADPFSPTIGVTGITTTNRNTIVAVPFNSLADGGNISVTNLVCTNGLNIGTQIYVFKDNSYKAWFLTADGWEAAATATQAQYVTPASGDELVASPGAIWVILPSDAPATSTFYIYGEYVATNKCPVVGGEAKVANLVANPLQNDATITVAAPVAEDQIIIPHDGVPEIFTYRERTVGEQTQGAWRKGSVSGLPTIKAGQGIWYVRKAGASNTTITWAP